MQYRFRPYRETTDQQKRFDLNAWNNLGRPDHERRPTNRLEAVRCVSITAHGMRCCLPGSYQSGPSWYCGIHWPYRAKKPTPSEQRGQDGGTSEGAAEEDGGEASGR